MAKAIRRHWLAVAVGLFLLSAVAALSVVAVVFSSRPAKAAGAATSAASNPAIPPPLLGRKLDPTHNAQIASVVDAAKSGKNPERLSALFAPHKFDAAAYAQNPQAYLNIVEPGRVWDTAVPAQGVKEITVKGSRYQEVAPLGTVSFTVTAVPNTPVTFTSFDGGAFQNELSTITVQADANGDATVQFTATAGTIANVHMLAACPLCSQQAGLLAYVTPQ